MVTSQISRTKTKSWAVIVGVVVLAAGLLFVAFAIQKTPVSGTAATSAAAVAELEATRLAAEKTAADAESARLAAAQTAQHEADRLAAEADAARVAAEQSAAEAASTEAEAARVAAGQAAAAEAARVEAEQAELERAAADETAVPVEPETVELDDGDGYLSELCGTDGCQDGETDGAPGFPEPTYSDPEADAQQLKESLGLDRDLTSGEMQFMYGCQQGYIPADQCEGFTN